MPGGQQGRFGARRVVRGGPDRGGQVQRLCDGRQREFGDLRQDPRPAPGQRSPPSWRATAPCRTTPSSRPKRSRRSARARTRRSRWTARSPNSTSRPATMPPPSPPSSPSTTSGQLCPVQGLPDGRRRQGAAGGRRLHRRARQGRGRRERLLRQDRGARPAPPAETYDEAPEGSVERYRAGIVLKSKAAMKDVLTVFTEPSDTATRQAFSKNIEEMATMVEAWDRALRVEKPDGCPTLQSNFNMLIAAARKAVQNAEKGRFDPAKDGTPARFRWSQRPPGEFHHDDPPAQPAALLLEAVMDLNRCCVGSAQFSPLGGSPVKLRSWRDLPTQRMTALTRLSGWRGLVAGARRRPCR